MFIAALDNTGVVMSMVLYCVAKYPDAKEKLLKEIN
jgi:cytochrome P450